MREFWRATFNMLMFIFLLAGCVHNIYHFQVMDENRMENYSSHHKRYSPIRTPTYSSYEDEEEELKEITSEDNEDQAINNGETEVQVSQDVSVSYDY